MSPALATGARCAVHPAVAAVEICQRCGAFVCGQCLELQGAEVLCASCFGRQGGRGKASGRAVASLVLGILGLNCGLVWGVLGLVFAYQELAAIGRGESALAGRGLATAGKVLGWINISLLAVALIGGVMFALSAR